MPPPSAAAISAPPDAAPPAATVPAAGFSHQQILRVITGILLCILLAALDQTVVIPAVPTIATDLHAFGHLSWIVSAYLLTSTAATPIYGKLCDMYGRRLLLLPALALFIAGVGAVRAGAVAAAADRVPGAAGAGRRRADGDGAGGDRRRGVPAGARALPGLHGRHLGRGVGGGPGGGRLGDRPPVLDVRVLDQRAARAGGDVAVQPRAQAAAGAPDGRTDRLRRRRAADGRRDRLPAGAELGWREYAWVSARSPGWPRSRRCCSRAGLAGAPRGDPVLPPRMFQEPVFSRGVAWRSSPRPGCWGRRSCCRCSSSWCGGPTRRIGLPGDPVPAVQHVSARSAAASCPAGWAAPGP